MKRYLIGDLVVDIEADCKRLSRLGVPYETDKPGKADITVVLKDKTLDILCERYTELTRDEVAYLATGTLFYRDLPNFDGIMLHSSAIAMDDRGYVFSAHSGTGKSTHTGLWKKVFGDKVKYVNDDKPLIRKIKGEYILYGTPWSGKTDLNNNISVPLKGIVFIERGEENSIYPMDVKKENAATLLLEQTVRPETAEKTLAMLSIADDVLSTVPVFRLRCNMSDEAVCTSYNALKDA